MIDNNGNKRKSEPVINIILGVKKAGYKMCFMLIESKRPLWRKYLQRSSCCVLEDSAADKIDGVIRQSQV